MHDEVKRIVMTELINHNYCLLHKLLILVLFC